MFYIGYPQRLQISEQICIRHQDSPHHLIRFRPRGPIWEIVFPDDSVFNCTTAYTICEETIREELDLMKQMIRIPTHSPMPASQETFI